MPRTLSHHSEQMSGNSGFLKKTANPACLAGSRRRAAMATRRLPEPRAAKWRPFFFRERLAPMWLRLQQLWQPGKVRCDPSRFIFAEQLRRRPPPRLILEIDVSELLLVLIAHDKTGVLLLGVAETCAPSLAQRMNSKRRALSAAERLTG